jgi:hypothetical protein
MGGSASKTEKPEEPMMGGMMVIEPLTAEQIQMMSAEIVIREVEWPRSHYHSLLWAHRARIMRMKIGELDELENRLTGEYQRVLGAFGQAEVTFKLCADWFQQKTLSKIDLYRDDWSKVILLIDERREALTTPKGDRT